MGKVKATTEVMKKLVENAPQSLRINFQASSNIQHLWTAGFTSMAIQTVLSSY